MTWDIASVLGLIIGGAGITGLVGGIAQFARPYRIAKRIELAARSRDFLAEDSPMRQKLDKTLDDTAIELDRSLRRRLNVFGRIAPHLLTGLGLTLTGLFGSTVFFSLSPEAESWVVLVGALVALIMLRLLWREARLVTEAEKAGISPEMAVLTGKARPESYGEP